MTASSPSLYEVLYISTLAPDEPLGAVAAIARQARAANEAKDITGLLIFDGMRFCQQIEGGQKEVLALTERIRSDPRHTDVQILHNGPLAARRFGDFRLEFSAVEDSDALAQLQQLDGAAAIAFFETLHTNLQR